MLTLCLIQIIASISCTVSFYYIGKESFSYYKVDENTPWRVVHAVCSILMVLTWSFLFNSPMAVSAYLMTNQCFDFITAGYANWSKAFAAVTNGSRAPARKKFQMRELFKRDGNIVFVTEKDENGKKVQKYNTNKETFSNSISGKLKTTPIDIPTLLKRGHDLCDLVEMNNKALQYDVFNAFTQSLTAAVIGIFGSCTILFKMFELNPIIVLNATTYLVQVDFYPFL